MTDSVFTVPFGFNNLGQTANITDQRDHWKQRIEMVLTTRFGERVMRPDFGSDLHSVLFENEILAAEIGERAISIAFNTWLIDLKLIDIVPEFDYTSGYMTFTIRYSLPSGEEDSLSINTAIFNRTGDLIQEIKNG